MKRHINKLRNMYPESSTVQDGYYFDGRKKGGSIWTSFAEEGLIDYWTGYVNPRLQAYLDNHNLCFEYYDSGTVFIYKAN